MSTISKTQLLAQAEAAQRAFAKAVRELLKAQVPYVERAPDLDAALLADARVAASRALLLESLPKGGVVAELGTADLGRSRALAEATRPRALHLFVPASETGEPTGLAELLPGRTTVHAGDPALLLGQQPAEAFDLVVLGGDASYAGALRGLVAAEARLRPGGLLVVNDYTVWSVASMSRSGVARAANEFANSRRWPVAALALQSAGYYDLCLRRPS